MKINEFEKQLSELKIKSPSADYSVKATEFINANQRPQKTINWSYVFAFSLLISLSFNLHLYTKVNSNPNQENLVAQEIDAQNSVGRYSIQQGAMIEHGSYNDIVIIMETKK